MLIHLKLEHFKIWNTTGPIRLAPLTLLLGTNSSGKSSLIQSLLLIRQTVKGTDDSLDLNFGNPEMADSVTLGQFNDVLCRHATKSEITPANQIGIEFRWSEDGSAADSVMFSARYRKGNGGSAELDYLRLGKDGQGFTVLRRKQSIYRLSLGAERKALGQHVSYRPERSFALSPAVINKLGIKGDAIKPIGPALLDELSKIIYLGPVRRLAQRDYIWSGRMPAHIGDDGAKAVDALIASGIAMQSAIRQKTTPPPEATLFKQTEFWLNQMNLAEGLEVKALGNSARYELLIKSNGELANLKDVGVGVSQVLPVIVAALFAKRGHIVMVEEPESHLHPLAQSQLAELFAKISAERGVQFIVETHSEHLFRRMQTLIAKKELSLDKGAMYFVERDGKSAKLRTLALNEFGQVSNWPDKFFGDSVGEARTQAMARAGIREISNE